MDNPSSEAMAFSSSLFSSPSLRSRDAGCPLVDYIENYSYLMRNTKSTTVDDKPKSDPLLESFQKWNVSEKLKKAVAQHLGEMTDLDLMLYASIHGELCPGDLNDLKAEAPQPVRVVGEDLPETAAAASVCGQSTLTEQPVCGEQSTPTEQPQQPITVTENCATEAGQPTIVSEHSIQPEELQDNNDQVMREWNSQEWKDWLGDSQEPRQKWSKQEWKVWLANHGFNSMREYERVVRNKHRKPSTKWTY